MDGHVDAAASPSCTSVHTPLPYCAALHPCCCLAVCLVVVAGEAPDVFVCSAAQYELFVVTSGGNIVDNSLEPSILDALALPEVDIAVEVF